ncbi:unnamed protein product [Polarella glacialis]|uniref:Uncharacterized protein n=1 Tax=Polarella glacialis TaxID=89957 RepID=A0A813FW13_POLGL|nr:unnamed protein product [Polarella glacialis]
MSSQLDLIPGSSGGGGGGGPTIAGGGVRLDDEDYAIEIGKDTAEPEDDGMAKKSKMKKDMENEMKAFQMEAQKVQAPPKLAIPKAEVKKRGLPGFLKVKGKAADSETVEAAEVPDEKKARIEDSATEAAKGESADSKQPAGALGGGLCGYASDSSEDGE